MNLQDYNRTIAMLVHLIVMNNAYGVAKALKEQGYDTKNFIPAPELEAALLQLHMVNRDKFFDIIKNITWNRGHVNTNKQEVIDNMINLTQRISGLQVDHTNWWPELIKFIESQVYIR